MSHDRVGPARLAPALLVLTLLAITGCGGSAPSSGSVGGVLPSCVSSNGDVGVRPPGRWLRSFPLPRGTSLDAVRNDASYLVLEGHVPGDIAAARDYFEAELPKHGFTLGEGDAEEHEAETEFSGHGVTGRLKLHDVSGCDGALTLALAVKEGDG